MEIDVPGTAALIVVGSSLLMAVDASGLGYKKGDVQGFASMNPVEWFVCGVLLWIVAVPIYLAKRGELKLAGERRRQAAFSSGFQPAYAPSGYPPQGRLAHGYPQATYQQPDCTPQSYGAPPQDEASRLLANLHEMRTRGLLTEAEFAQKKAQIVDEMEH